jgi:Peptidase C39 family
VNVNPNLFVSLFLAVVLYLVGFFLIGKIAKKSGYFLLLLTFLCCLPALSMILYYFHLVKLPNWYINFRTISGMEISVAFFGLFFGLLSDHKSKIFLIIPALALVLIPFIKPIIRPLTIRQISEWKDDVCIQSTPATCGPSSLASILRYYGIETSEYELAKNSYSCSSGTEIWYILRCGKAKGLNYKLSTVNSFEGLKYPSIIGVKLMSFGHFITVLGKSGDNFIIGDPLSGKSTLNRTEFEKLYKLDGMMIEFSK